MENKPSDKQQQILDFVNHQVLEKGYPPSVREICSAVGFKSTSTVHSYLQKLQKDGLILKDATKPRALKVINNQKTKPLNSQATIYNNRELVDVPIVGKVTAGMPILAVENIEDTFPIPIDYTHNSVVFMLKVQGDSMIEVGIFDGDLVLVKQQATAQNGDIVVALIEDEATVKTFFKEDGYIRLQPQNQYLEPIIVKENLSILGKVIGLFRSF